MVEKTTFEGNPLVWGYVVRTMRGLALQEGVSVRVADDGGWLIRTWFIRLEGDETAIRRIMEWAKAQ